MRAGTLPTILGLIALLTPGGPAGAGERSGTADWLSWRGDGSGASHSGAEMVDSLDEAKLAWQSEPAGLSGCMYPGGNPGTGWCDPIIADGRVFCTGSRAAGRTWWICTVWRLPPVGCR